MELKQKATATGFRVLFLLDMLLKCPHSKEEILSKLSSNPLISNVTKETLRLDLNTLKSAGFEIENMGKTNGYKYKINRSPIKFNLTKEETRVLTEARDAILKLCDLEYLLKLYGLFEKISGFIENEETKNEVMNFGRILSVDFSILKDLIVLSRRKKEVMLVYKSSSGDKKEIKIKLKEVKFSDLKLYVTGRSLDFPNDTVLKAERILKIVRILNSDKNNKKQKPKAVVYKVKPEIKDSVGLLDEEKVLKEGKSFIQIEYKAPNDFMAIQRLLSFGDGLVDIKNIDFKEKYSSILKDIRSLYETNKEAK